MALAVLFSYGITRAQEQTPPAEPALTETPSQPQFTAMDLINTINNLRVTNGLLPLAVHPVLMQVAQTEASGIAAGYDGHWRPRNLTLGQWLLSLGYPLSGDLSMDGYRSENWFTSSLSSTLEEVTQFWQGDAEHLDTMFSADRSDIGAALAVSADGQVIVVLETALRTASGKMQYDAYSILTGIPQTQVAYSVMATQAAKSGLLPQYSMPVALNTAQPNGNIYHRVQYGQSLWSIAIAYHTTIKQIQSLNRMYDTTIYEGQKLLVMKGATQPAPSAKAAEAPNAPVAIATLSPTEALTSTSEPTQAHTTQIDRANAISFGAIALAGLFLSGVFAAMFRKRGGAPKDHSTESDPLG